MRKPSKSAPRGTSPVPVTPAAEEPLTTVEGEPAPPFDIATFNPNDYEWRPVARRPRADGWSPDVQRKFIETLADTGLVSAACEAVDMSVQSAYRLRRAPGAEGFARAWDAALHAAADALAAIAFSRAIEGVDVPVFDRDGCRSGSRRQYNDRLLMFLLRAYRPDRFRHAGADHQSPAAPAARPEPPLAAALARLTPPVPADPHLSMPAERLGGFVYNADGMKELYELYPDLERERYVYPRNPPDEARSLGRRADRIAREARRWNGAEDPFLD